MYYDLFMSFLSIKTKKRFANYIIRHVRLLDFYLNSKGYKVCLKACLELMNPYSSDSSHSMQIIDCII